MRAVSYFYSSIGRKQIMGLTGLLWCGFVLSHMLGNLLIFVGPGAYNKYGHAIISNPFLIVAEALLVVTLIAHIVKGILVSFQNRCAKGPTPGPGLGGDKNSSFAVKTMIFQGVIIFVFLVLHIITFKYGTFYETTVDGVVMRDLHRLILEVFKQPGYVFWYVVALVALGLHLSHGFYSSFQSLGLHHPSYNPLIEKLGCAFGWIVAVGFISQPIYCFFIA